MVLQMARFHSFYGWVIFHYVYHIYHIFICSSINGHIGCLHISAIVNKAVMNMGVRYTFKLAFLFSLGKNPNVELLDHMGIPGGSNGKESACNTGG